MVDRSLAGLHLHDFSESLQPAHLFEFCGGAGPENPMSSVPKRSGAIFGTYNETGQVVDNEECRLPFGKIPALPSFCTSLPSLTACAH